MKFQKVIRIVCLLLAVLVLVGAVLRPLEVQAAAIAATAGVVGIAVETAIPWILSALSVAWLTTTLQDIIVSRSREELQDDIIILEGTDCIPAYDYGSQYYVESDIVSKVANLAVDVKNNNVTSSSGSYNFVHTFSYTNKLGLTEFVVWCNDALVETYDSSGVNIKIFKPCVVTRSSPIPSDDYTYDWSDEESAYWNYFQIGILLGDSVTYSGITTKNLVSEEDSVDLLTTTGIWIVDTTPSGNPTDGGKKRVLPVIETSSIEDTADIVETDAVVEVDTDTSTSGDISTGNLIEFLSDFWTGFKTKMLEIPDILKEIREFVEDIPDLLREIKEFIKNIPETLTNIWKWVKTVPQILVDALAAVFIPAEGYLDAKVDTLLSTYTFLNGFSSDAKFLKSQLSGLGTTPPVIYIPLGSSETSYSIGNDTIFLDLSWYAKYKPTVDAILSAFLWILFIWKLFLKLPGIVSGLPGDFVMGGLNDFGLADHLPSRKASYEIQRQSNREYIRKGGK